MSNWAIVIFETDHKERCKERFHKKEITQAIIPFIRQDIIIIIGP